MNINIFLEQLIRGNDLEKQDMQTIMQACMAGQLSDIQLAAFLVLLRAKGESCEELTTAAKVMIEYAHPIDLGKDLIDIVGTGGDGKNTFNVSTLSSIVAAAAGARVAKHGNHSVSSKSGSADVLLAAGVDLTTSDTAIKNSFAKNNLCFLFAPHFHPAMQKARAVRQQLGLRSFFNLLGPLVNPARVKKQVVGVFESRWQPIIAQVLANLGSEHAIVICARDGMDEVSISDCTDVVEYHNGHFKKWTIDPRDYQCYHSNLSNILVDNPLESLTKIKSVLAGEFSAARDITLLNTGLALYCANIADNLGIGLELAKEALDSGRAQRLLDGIVAGT